MVSGAWKRRGGLLPRAASGAGLCPVPDVQTGEIGRCHVMDDETRGWTATTVSLKAATVSEFGEALRSTSKTERHVPVRGLARSRNVQKESSSDLWSSHGFTPVVTFATEGVGERQLHRNGPSISH